MNAIKNIPATGLNKPISYRFGESTSKITIHPALFEALQRKLGSEKLARRWIGVKSCEACTLKLRPSPYVREKALLEILPKLITSGYVLDLEMQSIPYETDASVRESTKTEFGKPLYISVLSLSSMMQKLIKSIDEDVGKFTRKEKMNQLPYTSIAEMANNLRLKHEGKYVSFFMKKELIETFSAY